jgi:hypothetical protein
MNLFRKQELNDPTGPGGMFWNYIEFPCFSYMLVFGWDSSLPGSFVSGGLCKEIRVCIARIRTGSPSIALWSVRYLLKFGSTACWHGIDKGVGTKNLNHA